MKSQVLQFDVNTQKILLSSKSVLYKTENFIKQTKYIANVDFFVSKLSEAITKNINDIVFAENFDVDSLNCFCIKTNKNDLSFVFKFGYQIGADLNKFDIVFFDVDFADKQIRQNDQRLNVFLSSNKNFKVSVSKAKRFCKEQDFIKLYLVSNQCGINLPKLNAKQKEIVETTNKNVLVQGVAGSGKTNVCIDKIIFSACQNYGGKVLYTTFSRGLLVDTKLKIEAYKAELEDFLKTYQTGNVEFLDGDHKKALENKFGIYFFSDDDSNIIDKIKRVAEFLNSKVDFLLVEDIYKNVFGNATFVDQEYFVNKYSKTMTNHQLAKGFAKLQNFSKEIIFKEIFGMILGFYDLKNPQQILPLQAYVDLRQNSFSKQECETIYQIALDYQKHCLQNGLLDNNSASKCLLKTVSQPQYSLAIIDEVQDYSQVNLCLFKKLSIKMFCVGDALQMINPSYFSFGYLKNLLFEKDVTAVSELTNNYRNSKKIEQIIDSLAQINKAEFGTHSFVLKGQSIDSGTKTTAVYVNATDFASQIAKSGFDNFTFVVSSAQKKAELRKIIKNQEILTVSEVKGLERNTVVAYNLLSDNRDKWQLLQSQKVNHKQADENSVFRYYYNLFYVGVSRAKQNIFVVENSNIQQFSNFFKTQFENASTAGAIKTLADIVSKIQFTQAEVFERVAEFVKLGQYDNARFMATKILDDVKRTQTEQTIDINQQFISAGRYREAGIKFWQFGMTEQAKQQFVLSGDQKLIELVDACNKNSAGGLGIDIVSYFDDVKDNSVAQKFIVETVQQDLADLKASLKQIKQYFKKAVK